MIWYAKHISKVQNILKKVSVPSLTIDIHC